MNGPEYEKVQAEYKSSGFPGLCDRASAECSPSRLATKIWRQTKGSAVALAATVGSASVQRQAADEEIYLYCDFHAPKNADALFPTPVDNLLDTPTSGAGLAKLRSRLSGQFGIRLESTGARASGVVSRIIMQTLDASPTKPYLITFDHFILEVFSGGQFDLVERDADDDIVYDVDGAEVSGGESRLTIGTSTGLSTGVGKGAWTTFRKIIESDKIYSVVFEPGSSGDAIYSITPRLLYPLDPDQTPLPS